MNTKSWLQYQIFDKNDNIGLGGGRGSQYMINHVSVGVVEGSGMGKWKEINADGMEVMQYSLRTHVKGYFLRIVQK